MKDGFVKVAATSPKHKVCDVDYNVDELIRSANIANECGVAVLVFPELSVSSYTVADAFLSSALLECAEAAVKRYINETDKCDLISFIGAPVRVLGAIYDCALAVCRGELLGIVPRAEIPANPLLRVFSPAQAETIEIDYAGFSVPFGADLIFSSPVGDLRIGVEVGDEMLSFDPETSDLAASGANVIVNLAAHAKTIGSYEYIKDAVRSLSSRYSLACITATAGEGESGTDALYCPQNVIAEGGDILAVNVDFVDEALISAVIDTTRFSSERIRTVDICKSYATYVGFEIGERATEIPAPPRSPFIPEDGEELSKRCEQIFEIQSRALAGRMKRAYAKCAVIGVSGGLDSTLALLVAVRAADILGVDRKNVKAITMPCFGTTSRTKSNAERLSVALGTDFREIDIKHSVSRHFEDIGHSADDLSVVYENAQARERTQIIMDIANAEGGMVVGTGDLSELALGWATYNGDHMSMYGVNSGVPKTMMRHVVAYCADKAEKCGDNICAQVLREVLATPVSPELLPPKDGEIAQCTEGIVGPYELHDFFLYYLLRRAYSPRKIYRLAVTAFNGVYDSLTIKGWLKVFFHRFFSQQFKRSCLPDGPKVGTVTVSPRGGLVMPSDASAALWLGEIEAL